MRTHATINGSVPYTEQEELAADLKEAEYLQHAFKRNAKIAESKVQEHITEVVTKLGYNSEDSIAKYLVDGNPFYTECKTISLWIGSVWVKVHEIQAAVMGGGVEPTLEELIALLPVYKGI